MLIKIKSFGCNSIFLIFLLSILIGCSPLSNRPKFNNNFPNLEELFKKAYYTYQDQDFSKAKSQFLALTELDTAMWEYESYAFIADCYIKLGFIDSGRIVYDNSLKKANQKKNRELMISNLEQWANKYPDFPEILLAENGFEPFDTPPNPIGGFEQVQKNLSYPESARLRSIEGTIVVKAKIKIDGKLSDFEVVKSLDPQCDAAAVGAVAITRFTPAKRKGRPFDTWIMIPVKFRLK